MATTVATFTISVQYTPPSAAQNSGNASVSVQMPINAQNVGQIDVPLGQTIGTLYTIPFGSVGSAKGLLLINKMSSDVGVRLNGHTPNDFRLGPNGVKLIGMTAAPGSEPVASLILVTTAAPTVDEQINYFIFGD